jgi:hypothetical protein
VDGTIDFGLENLRAETPFNSLNDYFLKKEDQALLFGTLNELASILLFFGRKHHFSPFLIMLRHF